MTDAVTILALAAVGCHSVCDKFRVSNTHSVGLVGLAVDIATR